MGDGSRTEAVYDYLRIFIDENKFSSSSRLPSENYLSQRLHVCRDTVRKAVKALEDEGLLYRVKGSGTYFSPEKALESSLSENASRRRCAVIVQGKDRSASSNFVLAVRDELRDAEIDVNVFYTDNRLSNERKCLLSCRNGFCGIIVDGVKSSMLNPNLDVYHSLWTRKVPVIFYNNFYTETRFPRIVVDDMKCADTLMRMFCQKGHRHVGGLFLSDNLQALLKCHGCTKAILRYDMAFDDDNFRFFSSVELENAQQLRKSIWTWFRSVPKCTGIICCNIMLYRALDACLREHGLSVPEDCSVACFDYSDENYITEGVTCSVQQGYEMGSLAGRQLLSMISDPLYQKKDWSRVMEPVIHEGKSIREL